MLNIADGTARQLKAAQVKTVGLLVTRYTMEQDFYSSRLAQQGFEVLVALH